MSCPGARASGRALLCARCDVGLRPLACVFACLLACFLACPAHARPHEPSAPGPTQQAIHAESAESAKNTAHAESAESDADAAYTTTTTAAKTRPDAASTTYLRTRDFTSMPKRTAEDVLRQVPGVTLIQHGSEGKGQQFLLRGFDAVHGADLEMTVDGLLLNEWSNIHAQGYLDLGVLIPEMLQGVAFTKGPFTLGQGAFAMAGSADYQLGVLPMSNPGTHGTRMHYTAGTTGRHRVFAGYAGRPGASGTTGFLGLSATRDDGFGARRGLSRAAVNARLPLLSGTWGDVDATLLGHLAAFELPGALPNAAIDAGRVAFDGAADAVSAGESGRALAYVRGRWTAGRHHVHAKVHAGYRTLSLLENFTGFLHDPQNGDRRDQKQRTWTFGADGTYRAWLLGVLPGRLAATAGLGVRGDAFWQAEYAVGRTLERLGTRRALDGVQVHGHARAGLLYMPTRAWRVDAGARLDVVHQGIVDHAPPVPAAQGTQAQHTLAAVSPRLTARYTLGRAWRVFGAYGRGIRPPEARTLSGFDPGRTGAGAEASLRAAIVQSDAGELGVRFSPARWLGVTWTGFVTHIARESVFDHVSGTSVELQGTRRVGTELVVRSDPASWLHLRADATLTDARFTETGAAVPFAPWCAGSARAVVTHPSGIGAGLRFRGIAPRALPLGATSTALTVTDATLGYTRGALDVQFEVENLFDQRVREGEYHYASHWDQSRPKSALPALHTTAGAPLNVRLTVGLRL